MNIDFYFDFISPYSYLAATQVPSFEAKHGVTFNWIPLSLPRLMQLSGNTSPAAVKNKAIYSLRDLKRWATYLDVPFRMIRPGAFDSRPALRIAAALQGRDRSTLCRQVFECLWSGEVDPTDKNWLDQVFQIKRLPVEYRGLKNDSFEDHAHAAFRAGAFGVPTFILDVRGRPQMFFGMDHMDFLGRACQQANTTRRFRKKL
jgi:2-hydroxychromene-2-carboxylate isomerase